MCATFYFKFLTKPIFEGQKPRLKPKNNLNNTKLACGVGQSFYNLFKGGLLKKVFGNPDLNYFESS